MRARVRSSVLFALRHVFVIASLLAVGCHADATTPGIPSEAPYARGVITGVGASWGYRLEGTPGPQFRESKAYFGVSGAAILRRSGERVDAAALAVGQEVSIWITGVVRESYPVQGHHSPKTGPA
ncbi:MAG: hypothetical protein IT360_08215 [Gemmatimonadaceae bacterium]|nr:hypothetical protein [Gemmatimonadaceae bacterium]